MSRSNYDKPFYVDVGTSIVAVRCASNHDIVLQYDHSLHPSAIELAKTACDRMNREFDFYAMQRVSSMRPKCDWSVKEALNFANTLANHGWTHEANADAASSCIYNLCRLLKNGGNAAAMREALNDVISIADREFNAFRETAAMKEIRDKCCAALAAPPRNCDVGTPDEQAKRFALHCDKHPKCHGCQCCGVILFNKCEFVWEQMPYVYEEGETK